MILYLDTETTGLAPGEICQLSYIMQTETQTTKKNFFFAVSFMPPSAQAIHGFSLEALQTLSGGKKFSDCASEIANDFASASLIVAHNISFDFSFLREEFERAGIPFSYKEEFCTMKKFTPLCKLPRKSGVGYKYPRLNELCEYLGITERDIDKACASLFSGDVGYHDARFDTTAVYLAVNKAIRRGADVWGLKEKL